MANKNERAAAARAQAQKQAAAKDRRTTVTVIAVSLVVLAAFAGIVYFIVNSSSVPTLAEAHAPASAGSQGEIPVGATGVAGEAVSEDAVAVDLYVDLFCPACRTFEQANAEMLASKRAAGEITVNYHVLSFLDRYSEGTKYSTRSGSAAALIADRSPEHYVAFVDAMFAGQPAELTPGLTDEQIGSIAAGVGVPADVVSEIGGTEFTPWLLAATEDATIRGVTSTPTVVVDGTVLDQREIAYMSEGVLEAYLDQIIDG